MSTTYTKLLDRSDACARTAARMAMHAARMAVRKGAGVCECDPALCPDVAKCMSEGRGDPNPFGPVSMKETNAENDQR